MRLRTFESFWLVKNGILNSYPSLQENIEADIVVMGGGITGALISHALMEKGYKVTLLDRRDIGQGSTSATTSMLQYEIDVPLYELAEMIGETEAAECYKAGVQAISTLENILNKNSIGCGFERKKSLYIAHSKKAATSLKKEFEIRNKHNLGVQWLSPENVLKDYEIVCNGAILSACGASVDAYKLAHELIKLNVKRGMKVYDQTEIKHFEINQGKPLITTIDEYIVSTNKIIFCTGFETTKFLKEDVAKLFYTYACVSEQAINVPKKLNKTLVWDTNDPYLYLRTTDDGRLLVGGEDSSSNFSFFQQKIKEKKTDKLIKNLKKILPNVHFIEDYSWGGTFGTTKDGLPYIGKSPEYENALFVLGFGGNGITFSIQGMEIITDLLEGKANPLTEHYRFGR